MEYPLNPDAPLELLPEEPPSRLARLRNAIGLDRSVIFTIFARGWTSGAGLVTIFLIAHFLSSDEQGYYYTFGSLVALQLVFELGFSYVILQMASHERVHLTINADETITGSPVAHARLASVLQKSVRWYTLAGFAMALILIPVGIYFFTTHGHASQHVAWFRPWLFVVIAACLGFQIDPVFSFFEGCGYVPQVAQTRFSQAVIGSLLAWGALLLHHGLFAPAMLIFGQVVAGSVYLFRRRRFIKHLLAFDPDPHRIMWWKEVWPFQWRIAISWLSGYFIFQFFVPVLFASWGPTAAGQMGMSLNIANALLSISVAWVSTKSPLFGSLVALREFKRLDQVFFRVLTQSTAVCITGCISVWLVVLCLNTKQVTFAHRILPPLPLALLLMCVPLNHIVNAEALYLRSHKQEKFLSLSVAVAICVTASTFLFGRPFGALGMVGGYLGINVTIGLGYGTYIFQKYRKLWHLTPATPTEAHGSGLI